MESKTPAVSIIMSVWQGMPYVPETVESIIAQTFTDWEFIINDNASTDGTTEYLIERAKTEPRMKILISKENLGCAGGYNHALSEARAPWVAVIDADDRARPERLERQLDFVSRYPGIKVASSLAYYINSNGDRVAQTAHDLTTPEAFERYMATNEPIGILNPGAIIDRATLVDLGGYRQDFFPAEDTDLWARISERGMILVQPEYLMEYRVHDRSSITQAFVAARMKFEWSCACSAARRSGRPEPTWDEFLHSWESCSLLEKFRRWRGLTSRRLYRAAAFHWISSGWLSGRRLQAATEFTAGVLLGPSYSISRLKSQFIR